jgi:hypothetical protein
MNQRARDSIAYLVQNFQIALHFLLNITVILTRFFEFAKKDEHNDK